MPSLTLENSIVDERYEVRRRLNHGSYAEIYEAFDMALNRKAVIIKALNTHLQGTPDSDLELTLIENFQNEANALDAVRHRSVVQRLGHGTAADLHGVPFHYLVLEFVGGGDLMDRCRQGPLNLDEAIYYFRQVCEALDEAHKRGIIHRDIKPNNLLLSADGGTIKIIDFGVAKLTAGENDEVTRVGTDVYAPPEHNPNAMESGLRQPLTSSADVYSLAKTIYAAMTGQSPREFARREIERLPRELAQKVWGPALLQVLRRATAKRVNERYASIREFWSEFAALADIEGDDDDDTRVRPRTTLRTSVLPPAAPAPEFEKRLAPAGGDGNQRILVELEGRNTPVPQPPTRITGSQKPTSPATRTAALPATGYSYRDDLRDLFGTGWRLRMIVLSIVLLLMASVAGVYFEVHKYVTQQSGLEGTIRPQQAWLRDAPQGNQLARLPQGTRLRIIGRNQDGDWFQVQIIETGGPTTTELPPEGWVSAQVVETTE